MSRCINILLTIVNTGVFAFWQWGSGAFTRKPIEDELALHITLLSVVVTFLSFGLAGAAIWGYQGIKDSAEKKAEDVAKKIAEEQMKDFFETQKNSGSPSDSISNASYNQASFENTNDTPAGTL